jgi:hypothetical protein
MRRLKPLDRHPLYVQLDQQARAIRESNDCSVKALAALLDLSYADSHTLAGWFGRHYRDGMCLWRMLDAINQWGYHTKRVYDRFDLAAGGWNGWSERIKTPISLVQHGPRSGRYLIVTNRHVAAYIDGQIIDWIDGRCHRIIYVYKVEPLQ